MRKFTAVFLLAIFLSGTAYSCPHCESDDNLFVELPPSCISKVSLIIQNSNAYGSQDLKEIMPYIRKADKHFYKCENYDIAVGNSITVVVDRDKGIIYLTRYVYQPQRGK